MKFLISEEERELIKKMHSMISEDTSSEAKSNSSEIDSLLSGLNSQFKNLENTSSEDECLELKKNIILAWYAAEVRFRTLNLVFLKFLTDDDILKRMESIKAGQEAMKGLLESFQSIVTSASKK